jgi:uncharacterized membrane protein YfcA
MAFDFQMITFLLPAYLILGSVSGFLAGLLGIGGGIVMVPGIILILTLWGYAPESLMHVAVGTSLAMIVPTGFASARAHWKKGAVRRDLVRGFAPALIVGVMIGSATAAHLSGQALQLIFAVALVFLAALMAGLPQHIKLPPQSLRQPYASFAASVIGFISSLIGVGGATMSVPYMTLSHVPIHQAVGTASVLGFILSIPASIGFLMIAPQGAIQDLPMTIGSVHFLAVMMAPAAVFMAPHGAATAHKVSVQKLRIIFIIFMICVAGMMGYRGVYG